jgi:adenylate cyclase
MEKASRTTRLASWLIALGVVIATGATYLVAPALLNGADLAIYDNHLRLRGARKPNPQVVIVAIDEASLKTLGRWPWPRNVLADLLRRLQQAGTAAVAFDIIFSEPERSGELQAASRLVERLQGMSLPPAARREIGAIVQQADHDQQFAAAIHDHGRVILANQFILSPIPPTTPPPRSGQPFKSAIMRFKNYDDRGTYPPINADIGSTPIPPLLAATNSLGHVNMVADFDGTTRWEALVVEYHGYYYPSLALETVRVAKGLEPTALGLDFGNAVDLDTVSIPVDARGRVLIDYAGPGQTFPHYSAADVLKGQVGAAQLRDRIVFIGATAQGTFDLRATPFSPELPGVEKHANVAANILDGRFIIRPAWVELVEIGSILVFPVLLALVLPRLRPMTSLGAAFVAASVMFATAHLVFRQGLWIPVVYPTLAIGLTFVGITVFRFFAEERQRLWTKRAFQHYVSPEVVDSLMQNPGALQFGGSVRDLTVLFSDIRGFTSYSEKHEPQQVVSMLREHHTELTRCVMEQRGTLDKYIGDAVMAIFGAPVALSDHAERACRAALVMVEETERLQVKWIAQGEDPITIGIGINTGPMVVGNLGSDQLFSYTVVGDNVNLGARLESLNKEYKTAKGIIISESTYLAARHAIEARPLGEVLVKGKTQPVLIYELLGTKEPTAAATAPVEALATA